MDRYRSLYKENLSMLTPAQHNRTNREIQNANRAKSRRQIFESGRNIDVSPTPKKVPKSQEKNTHLENKTIKESADKENRELVGEISNAFISSEETKSIQNDGNKSRIALVASSKANAKKATRQETFLLRFIEWKEAQKQKEQKKKEPKRRPFVSSGGVGGSTFSSSTRAPTVTSNSKSKEVATFVPKDHTRFKHPTGLQNPKAEMTSAARDLIANDRKSFYTVVPTPPRNKHDITALTKTPAVSNLARVNPSVTPAAGAFKSTKLSTASKLVSTNSTSTKSVAKTTTIPRTCTKPTAVIAPNKNTLGSILTYPSSATTTTPGCGIKNSNLKTDKLGVKGPKQNNICTVKKIDANERQTLNRLNSVHKFTRPQPPKAPTTLTRKPIPRTKTNGTAATANTQKPATTGITTGAVGKAHLLQSKRAAAVAAANPNQQRNAKFATSFKAKKTQAATFNRPNAPCKITIKGKTLLGGTRTCATDTAFAIAETPTDLLNINPYGPSVTSTRLKSLSPHTTITPNISPIPINKEMDIAVTNNLAAQQNKRTHSTTSAKRTLLQNEAKVGTRELPNQLQKQKTKFNFVRYSVGLSELDTSGEVGKNGVDIEDAEQGKEVNDVKSMQEVTVLEIQPKEANANGNPAMPPQSATNCESAPQEAFTSNESERPVNYVGSFVSVSRGKVSARKEREKRDSIYVPSADVTLMATATNTPIKASKEEVAYQAPVATPINIEARRTLEAVRYFRQQLTNEIERLHALCDQWEEYKQQNLSLLQQTGGEDMIDVTIGQTKLLTSKKFQQFRGLIDRCEGGVRGTAAAYDGSEKTKPIKGEDLEGFWSMLNLQVDNVEKRFENLTRWKVNNWSDPEDVSPTNKQSIPKVKPNLTKVKKAKAPAKTAKASSGLQAMLRKMHAEMRKNKPTEIAAGTDTNVALILTPTRQRQRRSHSGTPKIECTAEQRNSTPRRVSVVVRDRKSLSAAATVISLPADSEVVSAVAAQRRLSRMAATAAGESPKSLKVYGNELRRSLSNMEKAFGDCNDLLRSALTGNASKARRSGTPNFIESPLDTEVKEHKPQEIRTLSSTPPPAPVISRKSILKTPGTAKGKPKNVIFNEKLRVKKFKFTLEDDDKLSDEEELRMQTSTEEPLDDQRTYSLRTRKVVLRPSSEFEIPKA